MTYRFNHVAFTVKNLEESIAWYKHVLGFNLTFRYEKPHIKIVNLKLNDFVLELLEFGERTDMLPNYRKTLNDDLHVVGTKHLCIETDDLDGSILDLEKKGVEFASEIDIAASGGRFIFFKDCNGILLELYGI
jgi:catechol 2,3-dioxygenase-like lactoylglutathione lyase family enzyme